MYDKYSAISFFRDSKPAPFIEKQLLINALQFCQYKTKDLTASCRPDTPVFLFRPEPISLPYSPYVFRMTGSTVSPNSSYRETHSFPWSDCMLVLFFSFDMIATSFIVIIDTRPAVICGMYRTFIVSSPYLPVTCSHTSAAGEGVFPHA